MISRKFSRRDCIPIGTMAGVVRENQKGQFFMKKMRHFKVGFPRPFVLPQYPGIAFRGDGPGVAVGRGWSQ